MKVLSAFLTSLLVLIALTSAAWAQSPLTNDEFGVTATVPAGWESSDGNDRAVFHFTHAESNSQIEVIGTRLMTADVADVFFETFHETLQNSEFGQIGREDKTIGAYSGTETLYEFTHSGVTLKVGVFQFVNDAVAWIVVAYIQTDAFDEYVGAYQEVISSMTFAAAE